MRPMLAWSAVGTSALAGVLFLAALAAPAGPVPAMIALVAIIFLFLLAWYTTHRQSAYADELMLAVSREATSAAFYISVMVGGGWALLAHLGFLAGPQPLDWLTMFAGFMLLGAFAITVRRGLIRRT